MTQALTNTVQVTVANNSLANLEECLRIFLSSYDYISTALNQGSKALLGSLTLEQADSMEEDFMVCISANMIDLVLSGLNPQDTSLYKLIYNYGRERLNINEEKWNSFVITLLNKEVLKIA